MVWRGILGSRHGEGEDDDVRREQREEGGGGSWEMRGRDMITYAFDVAASCRVQFGSCGVAR